MARHREVKPISSRDLTFGDIIIEAFSGEKILDVRLVCKEEHKQVEALLVAPLISYSNPGISLPIEAFTSIAGTVTSITTGEELQFLNPFYTKKLINPKLRVEGYFEPKKKSVYRRDREGKIKWLKKVIKIARTVGSWIVVDHLDVEELLCGDLQEYRQLAKNHLEEHGLESLR